MNAKNSHTSSVSDGLIAIVSANLW